MNTHKNQLIAQMLVYENRLISDEHNFDEDSLCEWLWQACEFAFDNFKQTDTMATEIGYTYDFEARISNIAMRLMMGLKKVYPSLKGSQKVLDTILSIIDTPKYADGRRSFILALWENKFDVPFINIIQQHSEFWKKPLFADIIIWGLIKRKIAGFALQMQTALNDFTDKQYVYIRKYCQKYLTDEPKYRHFMVLLNQ